MTRMKRISKKKLKEPDEFITFTEKTIFFITHHQKKLAVGGIIVLIILLSAFFFQRWEKKNEEEAYQKFSLAMQIYQLVNSSNQEKTLSEYKNVLEKFDEVTNNFPRTSSGKFSYLYKGNIHLQLAEFEEAIKAYQAFLKKAGKEKFYRVFAMEGLGYAYEGKKDYEKAINSYQKILEANESFQLANAYLSIGRCYEKLGKNKEALDSYKGFLKVSQKSQMTNFILKKVSQLEK